MVVLLLELWLLLGCDQGWIQEFFVGGSNLKKLEKITAAAVGRAENWWFFLCFYAYFEKIGKKSWKKLEKILKNLSGVLPWVYKYSNQDQ